MRNLILNKLKNNNNIVRIASRDIEFGENICLGFVVGLSHMNERISNYNPQNVLLLMDLFFNKDREKDLIEKTFYPNKDIPQNIFIASEDEFMDKYENKSVYNFDLLDQYIKRNNIKIIYINDSTCYLYYRCGFEEYLVDNDISMVYHTVDDWKNVELKDDLIYIDKSEDSKYSISYREIKRELISKVVTEDFLTI